MSCLHALPTEILDEICSLITFHDLKSLRHVHKQCQKSVNRALFRTIKLNEAQHKGELLSVWQLNGEQPSQQYARHEQRARGSRHHAKQQTSDDRTRAKPQVPKFRELHAARSLFPETPFPTELCQYVRHIMYYDHYKWQDWGWPADWWYETTGLRIRQIDHRLGARCTIVVFVVVGA